VKHSIIINFSIFQIIIAVRPITSLWLWVKYRTN